METFTMLQIQTREVMAEITLGSPRALCARFGICDARILPPEKWDDFKPRPRVVKALLAADSGGIRFTFPAGGMLAITRAYFFNSGYFLVEAPKSLSPALVFALGLKEYTIFPGDYPAESDPADNILLLLGLPPFPPSQKLPPDHLIYRPSLQLTFQP